MEWPNKERDRSHVSHSELGTGCAAMSEEMCPHPHRAFEIMVSRGGPGCLHHPESADCKEQQVARVAKAETEHWHVRG